MINDSAMIWLLHLYLAVENDRNWSNLLLQWQWNNATKSHCL